MLGDAEGDLGGLSALPLTSWAALDWSLPFGVLTYGVHRTGVPERLGPEDLPTNSSLSPRTSLPQPLLGCQEGKWAWLLRDRCGQDVPVSVTPGLTPHLHLKICVS